MTLEFESTNHKLTYRGAENQTEGGHTCSDSLKSLQLLEADFKYSDEFISHEALAPSNFELDKGRAVATSMELRVMNKRLNQYDERDSYTLKLSSHCGDLLLITTLVWNRCSPMVSTIYASGLILKKVGRLVALKAKRTRYRI